MSASLPSSLVLLGAGKMGAAMLEGWIDTGLDPKVVTILDPKPSAEIANLCRAHVIRLNPSLADVEPPSALVVAIKPQSLAEAAPVAARLIAPFTCLLSI